MSQPKVLRNLTAPSDLVKLPDDDMFRFRSPMESGQHRCLADSEDLQNSQAARALHFIAERRDLYSLSKDPMTSPQRLP